MLVHHLDEWVLIADDDEPERVWQDEKQALANLKADGWEVVAGPSIVVADLPDQPRREVLGYALRRILH